MIILVEQIWKQSETESVNIIEQFLLKMASASIPGYDTVVLMFL